MKLFKTEWQPNFTEIHEYTQDLQRITMLRDKSEKGEEVERYNTIIKVMQEVMIFINTKPRQ